MFERKMYEAQFHDLTLVPPHSSVLMLGTVNRAERNGEEGNDTAFYYWPSTTSVNSFYNVWISVASWPQPQMN